MRVVIADDAVLFREGLARVLEAAGIHVAGQVGDAEQLLARVRADPPDTAVVDIRMPPSHTREGLDAALRIHAEHPRVGVLVLSQYVEPHHAVQLLEDGASGVGYLLKDRVTDVGEVVDAGARADQHELERFRRMELLVIWIGPCTDDISDDPASPSLGDGTRHKLIGGSIYMIDLNAGKTFFESRKYHLFCFCRCSHIDHHVAFLFCLLVLIELVEAPLVEGHAPVLGPAAEADVVLLGAGEVDHRCAPCLERDDPEVDLQTGARKDG